MVDILHRIGIKAGIGQVFKAIGTKDGLAAWWTDSVSGDDSLGGSMEFKFLSPQGNLIGRMVMKVEKLEPAAILWRCLEGPPEWVGTSISFNLSEQDGQTIILFGHRGWREAVEGTYHCSTKWAIFLLSLRDLVETGVGKPSPRDIKIDNWN